MDIGKGDWVECINSGNRGTIKLGGIYHVADVAGPGECLCAVGAGTCPGGVQITGHDGPGDGGDWCVLAFRPLRKPPEQANTRKQRETA